MRTRMMLALAVLIGGVRTASAQSPPEGPPPVRTPNRPPEQVVMPTAKQLIADYNKQAGRVRSLLADVTIEASRNDQGVSFQGQLAARSPSDVRLVGQWLGKPGIDLGCNDRNFWVRLATDPEFSVHRGRWNRNGSVILESGWPGQETPDVLLDFLGMRPLPLDGDGYKVISHPRHVGLELPASRDLQGVAVRRRIYFDEGPVGHHRAVVHLLFDDKTGKILRRTTLQNFLNEVNRDNEAVPTQISVEWPAERLRATLALNSVRVNEKITEERATVLFRMPGDQPAKAPESTPLPTDGAIVRVSAETIEARFVEERLRLTGKTDSETALKVLTDQLTEWREKTAVLTILCDSGIQTERVKKVIAAGRQAGFRSIDVHVDEERPRPTGVFGPEEEVKPAKQR